MAEITFEKFSSKLKREFVDLNLAWLKESFAVEPHDVAVLEDCEVLCDDHDDYYVPPQGALYLKISWRYPIQSW